MAPHQGRPNRLSTLLAVGSVLLITACNPWWQRQPIRKGTDQQQACRDLSLLSKRHALQRDATARQLSAIAAQKYQPTAAPREPDQTLSQRYSQLDQQLDDERHAAALQAWRQREQQRRQRWLDDQNQRRQGLQRQLEAHRRQTIALEPRLRACRAKE